MPPPAVIFQPAVAEGLQRGVALLMKAIRPTLGPLQGHVALAPATPELPPELLDNAALIARRIIQLPDADADVGAMLLRQMVWQLHEMVGDGTATAAILFDALLGQGLRYRAAGGDPVTLRVHLEDALRCVTGTLHELTRPIEDYLRTAQFLCADPAIGNVLGEIFTQLGPYALIDIVEGQRHDVERDYIPGTYWHGSGVLAAPSSDGSSIPTLATIDCDQPYMLATDFDLETPSELQAPLRSLVQAGGRTLVILARSVSEQVGAFIATATKTSRVHMICVKTPGQDTTAQMQALQELALLTGCRPLFRGAGETWGAVRADHLGRARRAWATRTTMGIEDGAGDPHAIDAFTASLQHAISTEADDYQQQTLYARLGRFLGVSAQVRVGGATSYEIKSRTAQVTRAVRTLRVAALEGVVPGGGVALLVCREALLTAAAASADVEQRIAYRLLAKALDAPFRAIVSNSGLEPSIALGELAAASSGRVDGQYGYDVQQRRVVGVWEAGLLDSALVLQAAVRGAVKTAALCLTLDVIVHHAEPEVAVNP